MRRLLLLLLLVLAVGLAVNAIVTGSQTEPAEADIGRIVSVPEGDVQVRERGPRDGPAVILIHCYTCSMHWWQRLEPLLARDHRVISVDLLGHGGSEKPSDGYSIGNQADAIASVLEELGVTDALAVGQSLGGPIATALAERHRPLVRGVAVMDSASSADFSNLPVTARIARAPVIGPLLWHVTPDSVVRREVEKAFAEGFEVPDQFVEDPHRMTFTSFREAIAGSRDYSGERPLDDRLAALRMPVLVVFGAEDRIVEEGAVDEYRDVPGARVVELPGIGHTPQMEAPARVDALLRGFEKRIAAARRSER